MGLSSLLISEKRANESAESAADATRLDSNSSPGCRCPGFSLSASVEKKKECCRLAGVAGHDQKSFKRGSVRVGGLRGVGLTVCVIYPTPPNVFG